MLKDQFFTITGEEPAEAGIANGKRSVYSIELDPAHSIYQGHFPDNPVVPGVCQVEIIRELLGITLQKEMQMVKADNIKYLSMINPMEQTQLRVELEARPKNGDQTDVNATISAGTTIFLKFKGQFIPEA